MAPGQNRREKGTGTIYQNPSGTWTGRITLPSTADGKKRYKRFHGKSEAEVKRKIREYNKSKHIDKTHVSVTTYVMNWLTVTKAGEIRQSSYDRIETTIQNQIIPFIGCIQMQNLTDKDIKDWLLELKDSGLSYSVIKKAYDCMNAMLNYAVIKEDLVRSPMLTVKMLSKDTFEKKDIRFFSETECRAITEECSRVYKTSKPVYQYGDAIILILNTGLRLGEAVALKKSDLDMNAKTLHVQRNAQIVRARDDDGNMETGSVVVYSATKTYSGDRIIPLNNAAQNAVERLLCTNPQSEFLICNSHGDSVPHDRIERTFAHMLENIGLERCGVHALRHTFASILFSKGVDVKTVSKLLGHSSIQITLNTYIHMIEGMDVSAVKKLDDIF